MASEISIKRPRCFCGEPEAARCRWCRRARCEAHLTRRSCDHCATARAQARGDALNAGWTGGLLSGIAAGVAVLLAWPLAAPIAAIVVGPLAGLAIYHGVIWAQVRACAARLTPPPRPPPAIPVAVAGPFRDQPFVERAGAPAACACGAAVTTRCGVCRAGRCSAHVTGGVWARGLCVDCAHALADDREGAITRGWWHGSSAVLAGLYVLFDVGLGSARLFLAVLALGPVVGVGSYLVQFGRARAAARVRAAGR
ncbi:MAG: hypothetical protein R3B06_26265 [Kofleriaceae bacterium]